MSRVRLVSIVHPSNTAPVPERRFELLAHVEATILASADTGDGASSTAVRRVNVPTKGRGRAARFPSLATALTLLDPAIVHLQSNPDSRLAYQVVNLGAAQQRFGLVLETYADHCGLSGWNVIPSLRTRRVLANTGALIARSAGALTQMRRLGFKGLGIVAGSGQELKATPLSRDARCSLAIGSDVVLVLGWAGPANIRSGILDVFEAISASQANVVLVIAASGRRQQDLIDRADALEILDQIRFVTPLRPETGRHTAMDLAGQPMMAGAIGILLLGPSHDRADRSATIKNVEFAQVNGVPIIYPQHLELADIVGPGGWAVPPADPSMLARLITTLCHFPNLLTEASTAATNHAVRRHSPEAAAVDLDRAIHAVIASHGGTRSSAETLGVRAGIRLAFKRMPSRT